MKFNHYTPLGPVLTTSSNTTTSQTITMPGNASGFLISVATADALCTFDTSTPTATNSILFPKAVSPQFVPVMPALLSGAQKLTFLGSGGTAAVTVQPLE